MAARSIIYSYEFHLNCNYIAQTNNCNTFRHWCCCGCRPAYGIPCGAAALIKWAQRDISRRTQRRIRIIWCQSAWAFIKFTGISYALGTVWACGNVLPVLLIFSAIWIVIMSIAIIGMDAHRGLYILIHNLRASFVLESVTANRSTALHCLCFLKIKLKVYE